MIFGNYFLDMINSVIMKENVIFLALHAIGLKCRDVGIWVRPKGQNVNILSIFLYI